MADYFAMLEKELRGIPYSKTEHRNALRALLSNRSDTSIERKHQNIRAILIEARFPYIRRIQPRYHVERRTPSEVDLRFTVSRQLAHATTWAI